MMTNTYELYLGMYERIQKFDVVVMQPGRLACKRCLGLGKVP